jgi:hypothetical protein
LEGADALLPEVEAGILIADKAFDAGGFYGGIDRLYLWLG